MKQHLLRRVRMRLAPALALSVLVTAGCSGAGDGASPSDVSSATIGMPSKLLSLDMDTSLDAFGQAVMKLVGGRLYEMADGKPVPALAQQSSVSPDGLTWTFTLANGATFSDGTPVKASDVVASFERSMNNPSQVNPNLFAPMASVKAPSDNTVVVKLKSPRPNLPVILTYAQFPVLPAQHLGEPDFFRKPISAGPYVIDQTGADKTKLSVNPRYTGPAPTVRNLDLTVVPDANSALVQVQSGQLDVAWGVPANLINVIPANLLAVAPRYGFDAIMLNTASGPLSEVGVRRAIWDAADRKQISDLAWGGKIPPLAGAWPENVPGYDPGISTATDLAAAKKALAGTSCAAGCAIKLIYSTQLSAQQEQVATALRQDLQKIGITLTAEKVDATEWNDDYNKGSFEMLVVTTYDFGPVNDNLMVLPLPLNSKVYDSYPGMNQALSDAAGETGAKRDDALRKIDATIRANVPWIPLTGTGVVSATKVSPKQIGFIDGGAISVGRADGSVR
ncbi:ABC transporter substrate-binding protein [Amycolatopsis jejuensis]|uniref:ABC transporter substrate-binding protein n=1 Tax=Amycolatopsis jejuensis TaxID=330084 RepID=UPI00052530DF|nr:ABC transporter substrate-binding protein [Amycolatopsis jejuensis]